ncbi:hypothetical protein BASA81_012902 [Batrachochytrium salamandrivorans]|nr:hypothetical protein BASA81_012902 [Batrachochytrium salamandrivorans]
MDHDLLWSVRAASTDVDGLRRAGICQALIDAIKEKEKIKKFPTATQYYVAALSTLATNLANAGKAEESQAAKILSINGDVLYILTKILPEVPPAVLRLDSEAALTALATATSRSTNLGCRSGLRCLGIMLAGTPKELWQRPIVARSFKVCLAKLLDENPKVRKAAQESVLEIVSKKQRDYALDICLDTIQASFSSSSKKNDKTVLRLLFFAKSLFPMLNKKALQQFGFSLLLLVEQNSTGTHALISEHALLTLAALLRTNNSSGSESWNQEVTEEMIQRLIKLGAVLPVIPYATCLETLASVEDPQGRVSICQALLDILFRQQQKIFPNEVECVGKCLGQVCALEGGSMGLMLAAFASTALHPQMQQYWVQLLPACTLLVSNVATTGSEPALVEVTEKAVTSRVSLVDWKTGVNKTNADWLSVVQDLIVACADKLGPQRFFQHFPLTQSKQDLAVDGAKLCLFSSLQEAWARPSNDLVLLSVFDSYLLKIARFAEESSIQAEEERMEMNAKMYHTRSVQLWAFLPSFCAGASDFATTFPNQLEKKFLAGLRDPELCPIVAKSITAVIQSCFDNDVEEENGVEVEEGDEGGEKASEEGSDDENDEDDDSIKTPVPSAGRPRRIKSQQERERDLLCLQQAEEVLLPPLFNMYDAAFRQDSAGPRAQALFSAMEWYAKICTEAFRSGMFSKVLKLFLEAAGREDTETCRVVLGITTALAPSLKSDQLDMLLKFLHPQLLSESCLDDAVQKRAYACLIAGMKSNPDWVGEHSVELIELFQNSLATCTKSQSKAHLLTSLQEVLTTSRLPKLKEFCAEMVGEVVLALKESNARSRNAAFALYTALAKKMEHIGELHAFFQMSSAGLFTKTPHFRSATIVACTRLVSLYGSDAASAPFCVEAVNACLEVFSTDKSREIARSSISLCKVVVIRLEPAALKEQVMQNLLKALLPWSNDSKNRFSSLIRVVFDRLIKRVGFTAVEEHIPADHRLLVYLRKQHASSSKKRLRSKMDRNDNAAAGGEEEDGQDEQEEEERGRGRHDKAGSRRQSQLGAKQGDDPVDLLDPSSLGRMVTKRSRRMEEDEDNVDDFKTDAKGRIIVPKDDDASSNKKKRNLNDMEVVDVEGVQMDEDEEDTEASKPQRKKKKAKPEQTFGKEFKAKKAGGDAKYKGAKTDPYAYIPLDPRLLNKRKKHVAVARFQGVGKVGKKGYKKRD